MSIVWASPYILNYMHHNPADSALGGNSPASGEQFYGDFSAHENRHGTESGGPLKGATTGETPGP